MPASHDIDVDLEEARQPMKAHRSSSTSRQPRRLALLAGVIAGLAVGVAPVASAGAATTPPPVTPVVSASASICNTTASLSQPFLAWKDSNYYDLVLGGDFETSVTGWTLAGGAAVVAGSEPFAATGTLGAHSMYLPAGSSVQSPYFCVTANEPSFRFFAKNDSALAGLVVEVVYQTPAGVAVAFPVGSVTATGNWVPATAMPTGAALAVAADKSGSAEVALRFVALLGPSQIDDIFVDPHCK
jgi:hypothetical protein